MFGRRRWPSFQAAPSALAPSPRSAACKPSRDDLGRSVAKSYFALGLTLPGPPKDPHPPPET